MTVQTLPKPNKTPALRLASRRLALLPPSAGRPVAHPFTHDESRTRCPACELRAYLDD
jgi:hypothetical protein